MVRNQSGVQEFGRDVGREEGLVVWARYQVPDGRRRKCAEFAASFDKRGLM